MNFENFGTLNDQLHNKGNERKLRILEQCVNGEPQNSQKSTSQTRGLLCIEVKVLKQYIKNLKIKNDKLQIKKVNEKVK